MVNNKIPNIQKTIKKLIIKLLIRLVLLYKLLIVLSLEKLNCCTLSILIFFVNVYLNGTNNLIIIGTQFKYLNLLLKFLKIVFLNIKIRHIPKLPTSVVYIILLINKST